jgi:hypothetical protein
MKSCSITIGVVLASLATLVTTASAWLLGQEAQAVIEALLAAPTIKPEAGFRAKMLIQPGELYDPLFPVPQGATILMNDDGIATDGHGSRILAITLDGKISILVGAEKLTPIAALDVAPPGFGKFAGEVFTLAQPTTAMKGATVNHVIQRIDLTGSSVTIVCTLPTAGSVGNGVAGLGSDARFGPPGSGFANVFYSITVLNDMIYQTLPDGTCKPFVDLSKLGAPQGMTFTTDGSAMLVKIAATEGFPSATTPAKGAIIRIMPDRKIDPKPVAAGLVGPSGITVAPASLGDFAGQIFFTDVGDIEMPVPQTQPLKRDGKIFRVTPQGELKLVASGFINPGVFALYRKASVDHRYQRRFRSRGA